MGYIAVSDEGGVALVRTDRPPVNALDEALLAEGIALGVVDEVVDPELVVGRALEVGRELAALPAHVYAHTKLQLRRAALAEADAVLSRA